MKRFFLWTFLLFAVWMGLAGTAEMAEIVTGLVVSATIARLSMGEIPACKKGGGFNPVAFLGYLVVLFKNLIISNIQITKRVLHPKVPVNPGIVELKTDIECDWKKLLLANSITLTPGTLTLDVIDDRLYVHWIDVSTRDKEKIDEMIKGDFERAIQKI
jgi:multicomponent Na+:H+ antiporter subunit E